MRKRLTDAVVDSLQPKAKRYLVYDTVVRCLAVRISRHGRKTFCIVGRYGGAHATRKAIGQFGRMTIDEARQLAQDCHRKGSRPAVSPKFKDVAEQFLVHVRNQKRACDVVGVVRREFLTRWGDRALADIKRSDVLEVVDALLARGTPYAAHHAWAQCRRLYNWAIARGLIESSPCDRVRPKDIIGEKVPRYRTLSDDELRRLWAACDKLDYPLGPLIQLLMITGQRRSEVAHARRDEFDISGQVWRLPSARMKAGAPHIVPLSDLALSIIAQLPTNKGYVFSSDCGRKPVNGFSKAKRRVDALMGDGEHFVLHDIRRTVRTRLSQLRVRYEVAEMVIGHGKKGLARVYDQHQYLEEMREALDLWAQELSRIVRGDESGSSAGASREAPDTAQSA